MGLNGGLQAASVIGYDFRVYDGLSTELGDSSGEGVGVGVVNLARLQRKVKGDDLIARWNDSDAGLSVYRHRQAAHGGQGTQPRWGEEALGGYHHLACLEVVASGADILA